jgi:dynein heavy chain
MEGANGLRVVSASAPALLPTLEAAVRAGLPVLVEDVGEALDPVLDPLLTKATYQHGARPWEGGLATQQA